MKNLWNESDAAVYADDPLALRVYSSRLLGGDPALVLHGGGNTSVKSTVATILGDEEEVLLVKGSGWDLATIEAPGFAPVRMDALLRLAEMAELSDSDMVAAQRAAMTDPYAPNPSVETILHAIIPFKFVDHSHADAVVTITNTPGGADRIAEIYGPDMLIVPYVMPGFVLARTIYDMTRDVDWQRLEGMILLNHGVFTFADDARTSYERHIEIVSKAEAYIGGFTIPAPAIPPEPQVDLVALSKLRRAVSRERGTPVIARLETDESRRAFASLPNVADIATRGLLTPDHVLRTKRIPLVVDPDEVAASVQAYAGEYQAYFDRHDDGTLTRVDRAPRWGIWPGVGRVSFGASLKEAGIIDDITAHTMEAIGVAEAIDGWQTLGETDIFDIEYWELEQAKLRSASAAPELQGKVALVTGAASGIGRACVEELLRRGAVVAAVDINPEVAQICATANELALECDVADADALEEAVRATVRRFGGLDIVICNAGIFPGSQSIADMDHALWDQTIAVNLTSQQRLLQAAIPYLEHGLEPSVIIIGSKNYPAPGPGAGAYSVAKAGITQLGRVAALELASAGVRVNVLHPDAVFDTGIWSEELLEERAANYGISVEEYKVRNLLGVEITSDDVARLACTVAGPVFAKTTGAQIPIDGGSDRVI